MTNPLISMYNNPRFQGSMQAFGGLVETGVGAGMTYGTGGILAPLGWGLMAHGLDHTITGMNTAITGRSRDTVTSQLLQKTGMSSRTAGLVDSGISLAGSMGGAGALRAGQVAAFPNFSLSIASSNEKELFNFTRATAKHMNDKVRRIPIQILDDIVKAPAAVTNDPREFSNAVMHYSQMWKNEKLYNVEVLYDKTSNTILHFKYSPDPMGPLKEIK